MSGNACASGMTVGVQGAMLMRDLLTQRLRGAKLSPAQASTALQGFTKACLFPLRKKIPCVLPHNGLAVPLCCLRECCLREGPVW